MIEGKTYGRIRDLAESLGFKVEWQPGIVTISERPRPIRLDTDLRLPSGAQAGLLESYLGGTPLVGLGKDFVEAERKWRVNAVFATAVACHESDYGRSWIAQNKRNLFGFMAYDSDPAGYAKAYSSHRESIQDFCKLVSRQYLNPAGSYFNGPHLVGVGKRYASDPQWATKVLKHCQAILS